MIDTSSISLNVLTNFFIGNHSFKAQIFSIPVHKRELPHLHPLSVTPPQTSERCNIRLWTTKRWYRRNVGKAGKGMISHRKFWKNIWEHSIEEIEGLGAAGGLVRLYGF